MILSSLLTDIATLRVVGDINKDIQDITIDSRAVRPGTLFVARRGVEVDSHRFIPQAITAGAVAIVCQELPADCHPEVTYIVVADSDIALGLMASAWYGHPSQHLKLVGVTGTNGKTTIATLMYEMARLMGLKAGLLSTVAIYVDDACTPSDHTTQDALTTNRWLRQMVDAGCQFAAMEVSSHACAQHRIEGLDFDGAIFTNLTRDHLDYHKTVAEYLRAKKMFFDGLKPQAWALTNLDDKNGPVMLQNCRAPHYTYSLRQAADFHVKIIENHIQGMLLSFNGTEVQTRFAGRFNASNLAAVYGASILMGWPRQQVDVDMSRLVPVAGRFQTFHSPRGITAVVDYAHTPDALVNVLDTIHQLRNHGRVITVVGCGGNRDKGKRPQMAVIGADRSDVLIITSDNPRFEDPQAIADDMLAGLNDEQRQRTHVQLDRQQAIELAVSLARPADIILVAGKGHETTQIVGDQALHFDDREIVRRLFQL